MATIKSYSDLQQSKKLAEILPLESADMHYVGHQSIINPKEWEYGAIPNIMSKYISFDDKRIFYPCWSLSALLGVLPMITKGKDTANPFIAKASDNEYYVVYATLTKEIESSAIYDNPIDACYELILKLHELKML